MRFGLGKLDVSSVVFGGVQVMIGPVFKLGTILAMVAVG